MYAAWVLSDKSRCLLLEKFPPKYDEIICRHITVGSGAELPRMPRTVFVVGYVCNDGLEALVVQVNGTIQRKDDYRYHITLSLDRSKGKKPGQSKDMLDVFSAVTPILLEVKPALL